MEKPALFLISSNRRTAVSLTPRYYGRMGSKLFPSVAHCLFLYRGSADGSVASVSILNINFSEFPL